MGFGASVAQRRHNLTHYSRFLQEKMRRIQAVYPIEPKLFFDIIIN